jgi:hypothetical protein
MKNRILFITLAVVLALSVALIGCGGEQEEEEEEEGTFIAYFFTPEGQEYQFDVVMSDGEWVKEWNHGLILARYTPRLYKRSRVLC